jgi:signal peptidase I
VKQPSHVAAATRSATPKGSRRRRFLRAVERVLAFAGLYFIIYHVCFSLDVVSSPSMSPTIQGSSFKSGDWVLSERVSGWFRRPRRWDVVRFVDGEGMIVMKRVIGFGGERVTMEKDQIYIDGNPLTRPSSLKFIKYYPYGNLSRGKACVVRNGYYVLGDLSQDSQDSRFEGPIHTEQVDGRPWLIVWPLQHVRWINP